MWVDYGNGPERRVCDICGQDYDEDDAPDGVCDACVDERKHDIVLASMIGADYPDSVKISSLYLWYFTDDEINEILRRTMEADHNKKKIDFTGYYNENRQRLAEAVRNGGRNGL